MGYKVPFEGIDITCIEDPLTPNLEITQIVLHRALPLDSQESPSMRVIDSPMSWIIVKSCEGNLVKQNGLR